MNHGQFHAYHYVNATLDKRPHIKPAPCAHCSAKDSRFGRHLRGCPRVQPLSKIELWVLARAVEDGWKEGRR